MKEEKNRKASYSLCVITGMLCGIVLVTIMDKLAVGISLGLMFATMYYLFFAKSDKNIDDGEKTDW